VLGVDIRYETEHGVAVITLDAPKRRNALTLESSKQLGDAVHEAENDEQVHAVVVAAEPPAFCAGADLAALGAAQEEGLRSVYAGFLAFADCPLPTIAAVDGAAVGAGLNLALAADVRIAGPNAKFDARFLQLGIHPGGGMTWMLQRAVGAQAARAMTLFGRIPDGTEALRIGLAHELVDDPLRTALDYAAKAAAAPRKLVLATKNSMRTTAAQAEHADAVDTEIAPQIESINSPEFAGRLAAMRAKISARP
jgi:enoyl-CoA hydratase